MPDIDHVHGNREVVAALEKLLAKAREGGMDYLVALAFEEGRNPLSFTGGSMARLPLVGKTVDGVTAKLEAQLLNRTLPDRDPSLGRDYVCYNMALAPISFDFLSWLVDAEMTRVAEGAPAPLKVAFWFGRDGAYELTPPRRQFFENVMRPAVTLLGAVETDNTGGRYKEFFNFRDIMGRARAGIAVPRMKAPDCWVRCHDYITITLRENENWPHRNSDLSVWLRFAEWLRDQGEVVTFIRDIDKLGEPLVGFSQFREAALHLDDRAVAYQNAKLNFFVANGPFSLALFMDRPWIAFNEKPSADDPYFPNRPSFWRDMAGLEPGSQYPWATADQRMIWQKPTFDLLVEAWETRRCVAADRSPDLVSAP